MSFADLITEPSTVAAVFFTAHPNQIDLVERGGTILFANRQLGLELRRSGEGFELTGLYGIELDQDFLVCSNLGEPRNLFEIQMALDPIVAGRDERGTTSDGRMPVIDHMAKTGNAWVIGLQSGKSTFWQRENRENMVVLHLEWRGIYVREDKEAMDVQATITLRPGDPLA